MARGKRDPTTPSRGPFPQYAEGDTASRLNPPAVKRSKSTVPLRGKPWQIVNNDKSKRLNPTG
jgi:hypothetical protein